MVLEANIVSLRKVETGEKGENGEIRNKFGEVWDGMTEPIVDDLGQILGPSLAPNGRIFSGDLFSHWI